MGLMGPIRWRREAPLGPWRQGAAPPPPLAGSPPPLVGFSPTWEGEEGCTSPLDYIRRGGVHPFGIPIVLFF